MTAVRDGALTKEALSGAVAAEQGAGRAPAMLMVGDPNLEIVALEILRSSAVGLDCLRSVMPQVQVDPTLSRGQWRLRESTGR